MLRVFTTLILFSIVNIIVNISGIVKADEEALKEVNAIRVKKGLRPFIFDANLTLAAKGAAKYRAKFLIEGHISDTRLHRGDFYFVPRKNGQQNGEAIYDLEKCAAGCAAWEGNNWGSCCVEDNYKYAGAYWVRGRDNKRYMHLFCRNP